MSVTELRKDKNERHKERNKLTETNTRKTTERSDCFQEKDPIDRRLAGVLKLPGRNRWRPKSLRWGNGNAFGKLNENKRKTSVPSHSIDSKIMERKETRDSEEIM
jgi:hypothetical protein